MREPNAAHQRHAEDEIVQGDFDVVDDYVSAVDQRGQQPRLSLRYRT
jgi:hypothetical protein